MKKELEYYTVRVYGTDMKYLKNQEDAKFIYMLTGRKTVTSNDVIALSGLGYKLTEVFNK